jgi:hypothetical protein
LPVTVVGAYYFWREHLRWSDFAQAQAENTLAREGM